MSSYELNTQNFFVQYEYRQHILQSKEGRQYAIPKLQKSDGQAAGGTLTSSTSSASADMVALCPGTISSVCLSLWVILNVARAEPAPRSWWVAQLCWQEPCGRAKPTPPPNHQVTWRWAAGTHECVCVCDMMRFTSLWSSTTLNNVSMVLRMPMAVTALSSPPSSSGPVWITWLNVIACQRAKKQTFTAWIGDYGFSLYRLHLNRINISSGRIGSYFLTQGAFTPAVFSPVSTEL